MPAALSAEAAGKSGDKGKQLKNDFLGRSASDSIAQMFEYHFFDQRFALILLKSLLVLPNHGIHCFLVTLQGFFAFY